VSGTLVVIVPTRDGFVIAADRRTTDQVRGHLDSTLKVRKIGKYTVVASIGSSEWADGTTLKTSYSADDIAEEFLGSKDLNGGMSDYWDPLASVLVERFEHNLAKYPISEGPSAHDSLDNSLFQLLVVHYDQRAKETTVNRLVVLYRPTLGTPWMQVNLRGYSQGDLLDSEPMAFGNVAAYLELRDGHDGRFDGWRSDRPIKKLLGRHVPKNRASKDDAKRFCRDIINASAEMLPLIDSSPSNVGLTVDIGLVSQKSGFRWLYRDAP
jgi:hypothetical protein